MGREALDATGAALSLMAFWRPRFERIAEWFVENLRGVAGERGGIEGGDRRGVAVRRAGRRVQTDPRAPTGIDVRPDGGVDLVDYKTGAPPSEREIAAGFAPQLPLYRRDPAGERVPRR